jgi:hypothetical protein
MHTVSYLGYHTETFIHMPCAWEYWNRLFQTCLVLLQPWPLLLQACFSVRQPLHRRKRLSDSTHPLLTMKAWASERAKVRPETRSRIRSTSVLRIIVFALLAECCIYHKPRKFDESSSDDSCSSDEDDERGVGKVDGAEKGDCDDHDSVALPSCSAQPGLKRRQKHHAVVDHQKPACVHCAAVSAQISAEVAASSAQSSRFSVTDTSGVQSGDYEVRGATGSQHCDATDSGSCASFVSGPG